MSVGLAAVARQVSSIQPSGGRPTLGSEERLCFIPAGETWQAGQPDGSQIFLEQISHHPPISAFELCGPNKMYIFSGLSQPAVSYKTNAVKTTAKGYRAISFLDGSKISIQYPAYYLKGEMVVAGLLRKQGC